MISDIVQSAVGKLLKVYGQTRPDISFEVCQMAGNLKSSDELSIKNVSKLFSNMKQKECKLIYQKLGNDNDLRIIVHSDAAYGNLPNGILMLLTETFQMEIVKEAILYFYAVIEICVFH